MKTLETITRQARYEIQSNDKIEIIFAILSIIADEQSRKHTDAEHVILEEMYRKTDLEIYNLCK